MKTTLTFRVPFSAFIILLIFAISSIAKATTFYTLADGNWLNTTTVWSTDGTTLCGCSPPSIINGDDVRISHKITQLVPTDVGSGGNITLNPGGDLFMPLSQLRVRTAGTLLNNGSLTLRGLDSEVNSTFTTNGPVNISFDNVHIRSTFNLNNVFTISTGDLNITSTGVLNLGMVSTMDIQNGDIDNEGAIIFGSASCSKVIGGDFSIHAGSVILGIGSVVSSGVIHTDGFWDANVNWCALGGRTGSAFMPQENCVVATSVCGVTLPVNLTHFEGNPTSDRTIQLSWETEQETQAGQFHLSKSLDGVHFSPVGTVEAQNNSNTPANYQWEDPSAQPGVQFYRLELTDLDGTFYPNLGTIEVTLAQPKQLQVSASPNPFQDQLQLAIYGEGLEGQLNMDLMALNGQVLQSSSTHKSIADTQFQLETATLPAGFYLLKVNVGSETQVIRVVKQ